MSKELERIKNVEVEIGNDHEHAIKVFEISNEYDKDFEILEKTEKALEIIKEMVNSDIGYKFNANSRKILKEIFESLPKEKQDLLKEVML